MRRSLRLVRREPRRSWTTRKVNPPDQDGPRQGVAVHWPGGSFTIASHDKCRELMRGWESFHIGTNGWSSIAYNQAACPHGRLIEGRGVDAMSGANGNSSVNDRYGSVLAIVAIGGKTTFLQRRAIRAAMHDQSPSRPRLFTHNDVRPEPTQCPGPELTAWVKRWQRRH